MRFACFNDGTEHLCRHDLDLVKNHKSPVSILDHVEYFLCVCRSFSFSGNHCISWNQNHSFFRLTFSVYRNLIFSIGAQSHNFTTNMSKLLKLLLPLLYRHQVLAQNDATLLNSAGSNNTSESFSSTARQNYDSRASSSIRKHLTQTLLLIGTDLGLSLNFNFKLRWHRVMLEIVFFYQWEVSLDTFFFHLLDSWRDDFNDQLFLLILSWFMALQRYPC